MAAQMRAINVVSSTAADRASWEALDSPALDANRASFDSMNKENDLKLGANGTLPKYNKTARRVSGPRSPLSPLTAVVDINESPEHGTKHNDLVRDLFRDPLKDRDVGNSPESVDSKVSPLRVRKRDHRISVHGASENLVASPKSKPVRTPGSEPGPIQQPTLFSPLLQSAPFSSKRLSSISTASAKTSKSSKSAKAATPEHALQPAAVFKPATPPKSVAQSPGVKSKPKGNTETNVKTNANADANANVGSKPSNLFEPVSLPNTPPAETESVARNPTTEPQPPLADSSSSSNATSAPKPTLNHSTSRPLLNVYGTGAQMKIWSAPSSAATARKIDTHNQVQTQNRPTHSRKVSAASIYAHARDSMSSSSLNPAALFSRRLSSTASIHTQSSGASVTQAASKSEDTLSLRKSISSRSLVGSARKSMSDLRKSIISISDSSTSFIRGAVSGESAADTERPIISLPTPVEACKDKFNSKLKASSSVLSLAPVLGAVDGEVSTYLASDSLDEYQSSKVSQLLNLVSQDSVLPTSVVIEPFGKLRKIKEIGSREYFGRLQESAGAVPHLYELQAFGGYANVQTHQVVQELMLQDLLSGVRRFPQVNRAWIIKGSVDQAANLRAAREIFSQHHTGGIDVTADSYSGQLFVLTETKYPGESLAVTPLSGWTEAAEIFWQVTASLAEAEQRLQFEHRDLHWGNIMVHRTVTGQVEVTIVGNSLSRATSASTGTTVFTRLDDPAFYKGQGDHQFEIYELMRRELVARSADKVLPEWSAYEPRTNVFWLHYLVKKLLTAKLRQARTTGHGSRAVSQNMLQKQLEHVEHAINPAKRRFRNTLAGKGFRSASHVFEWGLRQGYCKQ